jgi:hypothetical protein
VRTDPEHPAGTSIVYAVDADSGTAWLTGQAWNEGARLWLRRSLEGIGAPRPEGALPTWLTRNYDARRIVSAPLFLPPPPSATATVLSDSAVGDERRVTLRIHPARGTRAIAMRLENARVNSSVVDGRLVDPSRYRAPPLQWRLEYVAPPDSGFTLALTLSGTSPVVLGLLSRQDGIPPLPGAELPRRPPGIIAAQSGDVTLVYRRVGL